MTMMTTMMIVVLDLEVSILLEVVEENVMNLVVLEIQFLFLCHGNFQNYQITEKCTIQGTWSCI